MVDQPTPDNSATRDADAELQLPPALVEDLADAYGARLFVPPQVDDAVLAAARARLAPLAAAHRRRWWLRYAVAPGAGAAAAAAIAFGVWISLPDATPRTGSGIAVREDIDANGRIDIRDALALARHLQQPGGVESRFDVNDDGSVDQHDVDAVAMRAVALGEETRS